MRVPQTIGLICAVFCWSAALAATPWEHYLAVPSSANAKIVQTPTYTKPESQVKHSGPGRLEVDLRILAEEIRAGDTESFYLGLRLRQTSDIDGALREILDFTLADFLRIRPQEFLSGLVRYGTRHCDEAIYLDTDIFTDRFAAQAYEYQRRMEAIQGVTRAATLKVRNLCVETLLSAVKDAESHTETSNLGSPSGGTLDFRAKSAGTLFAKAWAKLPGTSVTC